MKKTAFAIALLLSGAAVAQPATSDPDSDPAVSTSGASHDPGVHPDTGVDTGVVPDPATGAPEPAAEAPDTSGAYESAPGPAPADESAATLASSAPVGSAVVQPGNDNPERDARGIKVISAEAMVPSGWNGIAAGAAVGGPEVDPATGEAAAADSYPACSASVTDNCLQTYERGRERAA